MAVKFPPQCWFCNHLTRPVKDKWKCSAFPDGIPRKILEWEADHRAPYRGDNGVRFEADEKNEEAVKNHWRLLNAARQRQQV